MALVRPRDVAVRGHDLRQPEVQYLGPAVSCDEDVCGLEIAVQDPFLVRDLYGLGDLQRQSDGLR